MVFTAQQALDIVANNAKVSADGSINTHSDVELVNPVIGETLVYDGAQWRNTAFSPGATSQQSADIIANSAKISANGSINTHSDVTITDPIVGNVLVFSAGQWINGPAILGVTQQEKDSIAAANAKVSAGDSVNVHSDVQTANVLVGDILAWDGVKWTNRTIRLTPTSFFPQVSGMGVAFMSQGPLPSLSGHAGYGAFNSDLRATAILYPQGRQPGLNLCTATGSQLTSHLFIVADANMRNNHRIAMCGLEQVYNQVNPFTDLYNPTMLELMNWNVHVINHFRSLCGNPVPIILDNRLNFEALWSAEKCTTTYHGPRSVSRTAYNLTFIPSVSIQTQVYGIAPEDATLVQKNNFPFALFPSAGEIKPGTGVYEWNVYIPSGCPWNLHMVSILRTWTTFSGISYNSLDPDNFLLAAFFGRTHIGMCIHLEPSLDRVHYRFTFSGPVLNKCLI